MAEEKKKTVSKKNNSGKNTANASKNKSTKTASTKASANKKAAATKKATPKKSASKSASKITSKATPKKTTSKKNSEPLVKEQLEEKKEREAKTIEISQRKLIVMIVIVVLVVLLCLVCFLGSDSVSKKYSTSNATTSETDDTTSSEGTEILEQATKESEEISDDERTAPSDISVDDYIELYKSDDLSLVLLSKDSCGYCQVAEPIIENIIYEDGVKINHVDVGDMSDEDTSKLIGSDDYFSDGYGTPLLMVVGENSIKDKIEGLTTKDSYKEFFKKYGFME